MHPDLKLFYTQAVSPCLKRPSQTNAAKISFESMKITPLLAATGCPNLTIIRTLLNSDKEDIHKVNVIEMNDERQKMLYHTVLNVVVVLHREIL
jgi:hypothetical protein